MFTDISGYTELSQRMSHTVLESLLGEYERIVREVAETQNHGRVVKNLGDSFLVVYDSAHDALGAAVGIQTAIARRNRRVSAADAIAVKIAVNAGDVNVDETGDVFGDPVNVCARMEKVATGGEILFSEAVYHAMNKTEVRFEEFGNYDFKGVEHPVKVFRIDTGHGGTTTVERAIVITDIAGFSRVVEGDPFAGERLLALHDETLFPMVTRHSGVVQNIIGDECLLTFERADDAVACMLEFLEQLGRHNASAFAEDALRVKCSIHWGTVRYIRGRALGDAINVSSVLERRGRSMTIIASKAIVDRLTPGPAIHVEDAGAIELGFDDHEPVQCHFLSRPPV